MFMYKPTQKLEDLYGNCTAICMIVRLFFSMCHRTKNVANVNAQSVDEHTNCERLVRHVKKARIHTCTFCSTPINLNLRFS